ncbi:MAG: cytidylate kinase-like family protein [Deltaproteobacteria bacterium]|nr:cytidylate kinase-like family protein [Deltaproteobacteria bacterium]
MARDLVDLVNQQVASWNAEKRAMEERLSRARPKPIVTISRQLAAGGRQVAERVAEGLEYALIDKEVVNEIARRSEVRRDLVEAVDERTRSYIHGWIEGALRGWDFDEGDFHQYLLMVVHSFSRLGAVVILGRGANFIPVDRPALHVRVIAPVEDRIARLMHTGKTRDEAVLALRDSDAHRGGFVRKVFHADWEDPQAYDLVINTGRLSPETAAAGIVDAVRRMER